MYTYRFIEIFLICILMTVVYKKELLLLLQPKHINIIVTFASY